MLDVIVVGSGPAGSHTAYKLAARGYHVLVLEKKATVGEKLCCTGIISQECVTKFAVPQETIFRQANSAKVFSPSGNLIQLFRPEPQANLVNRRLFDRFLAGRAQSRGVEYHLRCKVEYISPRPDKVVVGVKQEGYDYQLEAQAIVLADGFNSPLAKNLGLGQPGYFVTGSQTEVGVKGLNEVEVYFDQTLAPGFFAWLVPTSEGRGLAGLMTRQSPGLHLRNWLKQLEKTGKIIPDNYQIRYSGIPLKSLLRTFGERFLVVGDAAGQVKPTTGGGIYFGLLCADIASDTLHNAIQIGDLSAKRLSQYERDWRKKIGRELRSEYFARKVFEHLTNNQIDKLFSVLKSIGLPDSLLREESLSFDWHGGLMVKILRNLFRRR